MKRLLIKFLALCLLAQPLLANPLMMQGMRAHQSMVVMRTVLNTQKQNAGIFNNNVQKRLVHVEISPDTVEELAKCGAPGQIAAGVLGVVILIQDFRDRKSKKGRENLIVDTLEKKALERIKKISSRQEPILHEDVPTWSYGSQKTYPPGTVYGFDLPEGHKFGDPVVFAPQQNPISTPTSNPTNTSSQVQPSSTAPSLACVLSRDKEEDVIVDGVGAIANSGEMVQQGLNNLKALADKVHEAVAQEAALKNVGVTPGSDGGVTMGDVGIGTGIGAAGKVAAKEVAKTSMWQTLKAAATPYVEPVVKAATTAAKDAWIYTSTNPGTVIAGGVTVGGIGLAAHYWWMTPATETATIEIPKVVAPIVKDTGSIFPFDLNEREEIKKTNLPTIESNSGGSGGAPNLDPEKDPKKKDPLPTNNQSIMGHIFRDTDGHLLNTPENRAALRELVMDGKNLAGECSRGNQWFHKILPNGKQLWASVRDGVVRNGGLNETPVSFHSQTGFSQFIGK
jgi:hypothetical protein